MFTNEFGQTVKADWVSFSITEEHLSNLATTVIRSIVRDSSVNGVVSKMDNDDDIYETGFYCTGIQEEHIGPIEKAIGIPVDSLEDEECYFDSGAETFIRMLQIMFGTTAKYMYDEDGDYIIQVEYDEYIQKSLGI